MDRIEEKESQLLAWGLVDGYFRQEEIEDVICPLIDLALGSGKTDFEFPNEVIDRLVEQRLIFRVECSDGTVGFRSRMAETVRLLNRLRQIFPKHAHQENGWQSASTLVSDFRFLRRPRKYPRRDISASDYMDRMRFVTSDPNLLRGLDVLLSNQTGSQLLLSAFQLRSNERIVRALASDNALSTIVTAGTGSGKTLAFYLSAIGSIIRHHLNGECPPWVKVVALYPRTELLKDQLREILSRVIQLNRLIPEVTIRIGALFDGIPSESQWCEWKRLGGDFLCPVLSCPHCSDGQLIWRANDNAQGIERLVCRDCAQEVSGSYFPLTRNSLKESPPDILFTTTEMLNQRLSDNRFYHLFGIGVNAVRPPELVLLDEVHTYEGRHGAQVAYLLRRWKKLVKQRLRFVGLSATLSDAVNFFSTLTDTPPSMVEEISPKLEELESEGAEYMVVLRGDPVSQTALLSTTIQACMLIERCLDPLGPNIDESVSQGLFGQRTFAFTDDLDVTNRLYFNLMSAEGRDCRGAPDMIRLPDGGLAFFRQRDDASVTRYHAGQDWRACEDIGHDMSQRLNVTRVSSQDRGMDPEADIVVASSVLEVGFDDPSVGAVIQHKAPRSMAGFLQRKGRAGRRRGMRPWTLVVLSDYGRDRVAYQGYDMLFDPQLSPRTLPLPNRYIMRMQAVYALIDYLGLNMNSGLVGSVWRELAQPSNRNSEKHRIKYLIQAIRRILENESAAQQLSFYIASALKLPKDEVSALMWEFPRPLMTTVLPTALRRLISRWSAFGQEEKDFISNNNPLPEFVAAALFADLNIAEVRIDLPGQIQQNNRPQYMPLFSAMKEFAPGRVSRRFGVHDAQKHWVSPPSNALEGGVVTGLSIDGFGEYFPIGEFRYAQGDVIVDIPVYRPVSFSPVIPANTISDTSSSRLIWHSQFVPICEPVWLDAPMASIWSKRVPRLGFFTHSKLSPVDVRRFSTGANAVVGVGKGEKLNIQTDFIKGSNKAALGNSFTVDGVVFEVSIPGDLLNMSNGSAEKWRGIRTARYFDEAMRGNALVGISSPFIREWLLQIFLSALTFEAIQQSSSLEDAALLVVEEQASIRLSDVLNTLFHAETFDSEDAVIDQTPDYLKEELTQLLVLKDVKEALFNLAKYLWEPITGEWEPWLRRSYHATIGSALFKAIGDICSSIDMEELILDLDRGAQSYDSDDVIENGLAEVWITERNPGGSGLIEAFMHHYSEDPRRFFSTVRSGLEMGEFELIDHQLGRLLSILVDENNGSETPVIINRLRNAEGMDAMNDGSRALRQALLHDGFSPFHGFIVAIGNRILRPGTGTHTDRILCEAFQDWNKEEERLGIEIDLRIICFWLSQRQAGLGIANALNMQNQDGQEAFMMGVMYGLLWPRGRFIRSTSLSSYNPYIDFPPLERLLVTDTIIDHCEGVRVDDPEWLIRVKNGLAKGHLVTISCSAENREQLGAAIHKLITNPVDSGYLRAFARLQGVRQSKDVYEADLELLEATQ
ncbi:protein DpdJ [Chlorobium phaeovibrioides]|uniref:protein DpdJ n=1 Tax=Chlorobium phaeovibrioides TaxID=1094 RepID=UPI00174E4027|nr:protein DpdJ [Chlorobium phaeovibrioides]